MSHLQEQEKGAKAIEPEEDSTWEVLLYFLFCPSFFSLQDWYSSSDHPTEPHPASVYVPKWSDDRHLGAGGQLHMPK